MNPDPVLRVILVDESVMLGRTHLHDQRARDAAMEMLARNVRGAVGGVLPVGWESRITGTLESNGVRYRCEMQAIAHEHRLRKRALTPDAYVEFCWTAGCDYERYVEL